ncbi:SRPBCC domain-containing protein [Cognatishimia activa]|uniref:SRPBCC domain-containing protein n=1 Tax=Cognatishimia activa TaxID=1715691 RepID=UPI002232BC7F|nr:SRPBCC domain-containing protein [Cognatishimia activa]UZD89726.1 SRPBCC domain-containing protein [Cognatishimia activa]
MKFGSMAAAASLVVAFPAIAMACNPNPHFPIERHSTSVIASDHHAVFTEITINAPAAEVWDALTDFEAMPDWSPALQGIEGDLADGSAVTVFYKVGDRVAEIPHVISYQEGRSFGWAEELKGPAPGIFDNHLYEVVAISDCQSRLIQSDAFKGTSTEQPNRTTAFFAERVLPGYRAFNQALKTEVEK